MKKHFSSLLYFLQSVVLSVMLVGHVSSSYAENASAQISQKQLLRSITAAKNFLDNNQFLPAVRLLERVRPVSPNNVEVLYLLAQAYEGAGLYGRALPYIKKVAELSSDVIELQRDYARISYLAGDFDAAIFILEKINVETVKPSLRRAVLIDIEKVRAKKAFKLGQLDKAVNLLQHSVLLYPNDAELYQILGEVYLEAGLYEDAEVTLNVARSKIAEKSQIDVSLSELYRASSEAGKQREVLDRILKENRSGKAYNYAVTRLLERASSSLEIQDFNNAMIDAELIVNYIPNHLESSKLLSKIYIARDESALAIDILVNLAEIYPKEIDTRMSLANLYLKADRLAEAAKQYQEIIELDKTGKFSKESRDKLSSIRQEQIKKLPKKVLVESISAELDRVEEWISTQDFDPAETYLTKLTENYAENARVNFLLGKLYAKTSKIELAGKYLTRSIFYAPKNVGYHFFYADFLESIKDYNAAAQIYNNIFDFAKDSVHIGEAKLRLKYVEAEELVQQGQLNEALSKLQGLLGLEPNNKKYLIKTAIVLNRLGKSNDARAITNRLSLINRVDQSEDKLVDQARDMIGKQDISSALAILEGVLRKSPLNSKANYWAGYIYAGQNKNNEAIEYVQKSIASEPQNRKLKLYLAGLYTSNREHKKAEEIYTKLLISPENASERKELLELKALAAGQQLLASGAYDLALPHYRNMIKQFPKSIKALEALAIVYEKQADVEQLKNVYLKMIDLNVGYVSAYGRLSELYLKEGGAENWRKNLLNVIRYDHVNGQLRKKAVGQILNVARSYLKTEEYDKAKIELQAIESVVHENKNVSLVKAEMLRLQGKAGLAEEILLKLLSKDPLDHEARKVLAQFYIQQNRLDEAVTEYEKISQVAADDIVVQEALANLRNVSKIKADEISVKLNKDSDVNEVLDTVKSWIRDGNIDSALEVLVNLVSLFPDNAQVHYWAGKAYERRNQLKLAVFHVKKSVDLAPKNPRLRTEYGRLLVRTSDYDEAERQYNIVIDTGGDTAFTRETKKLLNFAIGSKLNSRNQYEEALAHYLEMSEEYPNDLQVLAQIAAVHFQLKNFSTAESIYKDILKVQPENASVHYQLALVYREKDDLARYNDQLKQVISLDPNRLGLQAANQIGLADGNRLLKERKWVEAIRAFQRVLESDKTNVHANIGISSALFESGNVKSAEDLLTKVLNDQPTNIIARLELAKLLVKTNKVPRAILELERIIFLDGDSAIGREAKLNLANIYRTRAEILGRGGNVSGAVKEYLKAVNRDPKDVKAHLALAAIYQRDRRYVNNSIAHYKEALKVNPFNTQVYVNLGSLYERSRQYEDAMDAYARAISSMSQPVPQVLIRLMLSVRMQAARLQFDEKNYDWVVAELIDMLSYEPSSSPINIFLSSVYTVQGELELAIKALREVLEVTPNNWDIRYRLAILYERTNEYELALAQYRTIVRAGLAGSLVEQARDRIPTLEDRVRNFNYSLTYSLANTRTDYPKNKINTNAFNSSLRFDFTTRYKPTKNIDLSFRISPTYSALHETQNDSLSPQYTLTGQYNTNNVFFTGTASFRETKGLLLEDLRGKESNFSLITARRLDTPLIQTEDDRSLPQTIEYSVRFREFSAEGISYSSVREISPSLTFIYPLITGGTVSVGYTFTDTQHIDRFGGDYANFSHQLRMSVRSLVATKLSASFSSTLQYKNYKNYDTRERFLNNRLVKRENRFLSLVAQLSYQFHRRLSLFGSVSTVENRSNIGQGFIYLVEEIPVGIQELTITNFRSLSISTGVSFRF